MAIQVPVEDFGEGIHRDGDFIIMVTVDDGHWHLSISHKSRYPTFDEIRDARYKYIPNEVVMAMLFPPKEEYVNVHPNCFHLWELKTK
jgi:hypothetical protein